MVGLSNPGLTPTLSKGEAGRRRDFERITI
jgi:hypothetical protein